MCPLKEAESIAQAKQMAHLTRFSMCSRRRDKKYLKKTQTNKNSARLENAGSTSY